MKITSLKVDHVRFPIEEPIVNAPPMPMMRRDFLTVRMQTDEGIEGLGVTGFGGALMPALKLSLELLGEVIKGEDPLRPELATAIQVKRVKVSARTFQTGRPNRLAAILCEFSPG